jgi:hypothetical protein
MIKIIRKTAEILIAVCAASGLILMIILTVAGKSGTELGSAIANYFFYFTILSNILVFILFFGKSIIVKGNGNKIFNHPFFNGAVTIYICMTGIVYLLKLRGNVAPGLEFVIANSILHYATPIAAFLYWALVMSAKRNKVTYLLYWLIFPLVYLFIILIRGALVGMYPYLFLDVYKLGYEQVAITSCLLTLAFFGFGFLLFIISRLRNRKGSGIPLPE